MNRYYEADGATKTLFTQIRGEKFEGLEGAKIKLIMDLKPKIDKLRGAMVFASIKTTNKKVVTIISFLLMDLYGIWQMRRIERGSYPMN